MHHISTSRQFEFLLLLLLRLLVVHLVTKLSGVRIIQSA